MFKSCTCRCALLCSRFCVKDRVALQARDSGQEERRGLRFLWGLYGLVPLLFTSKIQVPEMPRHSGSLDGKTVGCMHQHFAPTAWSVQPGKRSRPQTTAC
jgi:hypothetical protein